MKGESGTGWDETDEVSGEPGQGGGEGDGMSRPSGSRFFERVYQVVCQIPPGRVSTYGAVSALLTGRTTAARTVGWALHGLPEAHVDLVPWWRVINSQGRISTSCETHSAHEQRARLVDEGVRFRVDERVDLEEFGWFG